MKKFIYLISVFSLTIALTGCNSDRVTLLEEKNQILQTKLDKQNQDQQEQRCFSYEDRRCVTVEEKEIIKLIPDKAILREVEPVPLLDRNDFIGIYIENPIFEATSTNNYMGCSSAVRGRGIEGIYHLFTYSFGKISSDIIIPKSTSFSDYNSSLSAQRISMSWQNTKYNNFNHFNGKPYSKDEQYKIEISTLINFKDYNGDGYPHEFTLFGGEYWSCSADENLIAGYEQHSWGAIIYKIMEEPNKATYWGINFFPDKNGNVINRWPCGDHGSNEDITVTYKYNPEGKYYYFVNKLINKCY